MIYNKSMGLNIDKDCRSMDSLKRYWYNEPMPEISTEEIRQGFINFLATLLKSKYDSGIKELALLEEVWRKLNANCPD